MKAIEAMWEKHPLFDLLLAALPFGVWIFFGAIVPSNSNLPSLYVGISTIGGLSLAAATFVCTLTYQSANILMTRVRDLYSEELSRNWKSIIGWSLFASVMPLVSLFWKEPNNNFAFGLAMAGLIIIVIKFSRCLYWLNRTLFSQDNSKYFTENDQTQDILRDMKQAAHVSEEKIPAGKR